jgi:hypothetical protein
MMRQKMAAAQQQGAGATVYVQEDFTATTTGDLSANNLTTDELGGGWLEASTTWTYGASNVGVCQSSAFSAGARAGTVVQTDGREDVRIVCNMVIVNGSQTNRWQGLSVRSAGAPSSLDDGLTVRFNGAGTGPDLILIDGDMLDGTTLVTWDLGSLMTTAPVATDSVRLEVKCEGNVVTLVSVGVNGAAPEVLDEAYTLTGAVATAHGAGSGADHYGLASTERAADTTVERFEYFKVESILA